MKHHEDEDANYDAAAAELLSRGLACMFLIGLAGARWMGRQVLALGALTVGIVALSPSSGAFPFHAGGGQQAMRAFDFAAKVGVNTSLHNGSTVSQIEADLATLGGLITAVRDTMWSGDSPYVYPGSSDFAPLAAAGSRLHLAFQGQGPTLSVTMASWVAGLKADIVTPYPGKMIGVSGPNEPDINSPYFCYSDGTCGIAGANEAQADLNTAIKGDLALSSIPVDAWPIGCAYSGNFCGNYSAIAGLSPCDRLNLHDYYSADQTNQPTFPADGPIYSALLDPSAGYLRNVRAQCSTVPSQFVTTESGWNVPWASGSPNYASLTDDRTRARLLLDDILDHASLSYNRAIFIFQLRGSTFYGVINDDGTITGTGTALKNFMAIINDAGGTAATFQPGYLPYTLSGMPTQSGNAEIAKSNGNFDVMLWNETPIFNATTGADITIADSSVTVTFTRAVSGSVYNPLTGTSPISTITSQTSVTVALNDAPLILEVH